MCVLWAVWGSCALCGRRSFHRPEHGCDNFLAPVDGLAQQKYNGVVARIAESFCEPADFRKRLFVNPNTESYMFHVAYLSTPLPRLQALFSVRPERLNRYFRFPCRRMFWFVRFAVWTPWAKATNAGRYFLQRIPQPFPLRLAIFFLWHHVSLHLIAWLLFQGGFQILP